MSNTNDSKPELVKQTIAHLESLGYYHSDFSIYQLDDEKSLGIGLSWHRPDDGVIKITLWGSCRENEGGAISVNSFALAKSIINNFHFANEEVLRLEESIKRLSIAPSPQ